MAKDKKFIKSFDELHLSYKGSDISDDYLDPVYNYVVQGLPPGGMFTSLFANDVLMAAARSHPSNNWNQLLVVMKWIVMCAPPQCWGDYTTVTNWCHLDAAVRRKIVEDAGIASTVFDLIKDAE